ncbi:minor virion protein VP1 [Halophage HF1]|uniref:Minor virion protein VP1 n=1 Tax=Halophage HF1 TaxID=2847106 RepID=Q7TDH0_9CAUD|nr:minor virion protein VP1 [Halophage HF1]AAO61371.1 minor virion protein VP1 [Halophage HF1]
MAYTSKLKEWGAVAEERSEFPDGYRYTKENPPVTHYDNFLVHNLIEDVQHLVDLTNLIDPDNDGQVADAETIQGKSPEQLGGFKFIQTDNPTEKTQGTTWFKNSNHLLFVSDGSRYDVFPEVGYQEYDSMAEDGLTVLHETVPRTKLTEDGRIMLINEQTVADFEDTYEPNHELWSWTNGTSFLSAQTGTILSGTQSLQVQAVGERATPHLTREAPIIQDLEVSAQVELDTANINDFSGIEVFNGTTRLLRIQYNDGDGNVELYTGSGTVELMANWSVGTTHDYEFDWDFSNDQYDLYIDGVLDGTYGLESPTSGWDELRIDNQTANSGATRNVYVEDIHTGAREYGETVVKFPDPDERIQNWDLVRHTKTLAGESVIIDVEDESGTVLLADVQQNEDISSHVSANTNPQFRVRISRENNANNPSLDAVFRRWTMRPGDTGLSKKIRKKQESSRNKARHIHTRLATRGN